VHLYFSTGTFQYYLSFLNESSFVISYLRRVATPTWRAWILPMPAMEALPLYSTQSTGLNPGTVNSEVIYGVPDLPVVPVICGVYFPLFICIVGSAGESVPSGSGSF
jgi:hypothetical protein